MTYKHILTPVISVEYDEPALRATAALAQSFDAHATALVVAVHPGSEFSPRNAPLSDVLVDIAKGPNALAQVQRAAIVAAIKRLERSFDVRDVTAETALLDGEVTAHARCADLVVLARATGREHAHGVILLAILFNGGRPVYFVPHDWRAERAPERVLIGWNAKREAVRAINDAMPFLTAAKQVIVATVDAKPKTDGHGEAPGREIAAHLARHGVNVEVRNLDSMGRTAGKALIDEASAVGAELIVTGAYGHSRAAEFLFGGVTRELLATSPVPLLLSH